MASTTFATSLQALVAERDAAFISRVATELNLSIEELTLKYADVAATAFKLPKKRGPRAEPKPDSKQCKGTTAKGVPCKFSALPGGDCCKRHSRDPSEAKPAKEPKEKKEKPIKTVPKHTHDLDGLEHADCPLCVSQDGPFKLPPTPVAAPPPADSDDESDSEDLIEQLKRQVKQREEEEEANSDEEDLMWQKAADSDDEGLMLVESDDEEEKTKGGESDFDEE